MHSGFWIIAVLSEDIQTSFVVTRYFYSFCKSVFFLSYFYI